MVDGALRGTGGTAPKATVQPSPASLSSNATPGQTSKPTKTCPPPGAGSPSSEGIAMPLSVTSKRSPRPPASHPLWSDARTRRAVREREASNKNAVSRRRSSSQTANSVSLRPLNTEPPHATVKIASNWGVDEMIAPPSSQTQEASNTLSSMPWNEARCASAHTCLRKITKRSRSAINLRSQCFRSAMSRAMHASPVNAAWKTP
mmetsp:Transcript_58107/g.168663  ORF Transcript_58107/g.168663 Transcript_58107/m.168663 type:complete len:204 (-) Transcript_58107:601-1212(-)